jgi:hypothetical protein
VLREDTVDYILERFEVQLTKELEGISGEMDRIRKHMEQLEAQISNLVAVLADGTRSSAVMAEITRREAECAAITDRLLSSTEESVQARSKRFRAAALEKMQDLRKCLNGNTVTVRAFLLKHVQRIDMRPDGKSYVASGSWDFLGDARGWCRGAELNCLRRPFQGRALPVSYLGTVAN